MISIFLIYIAMILSTIIFTTIIIILFWITKKTSDFSPSALLTDESDKLQVIIKSDHDRPVVRSSEVESPEKLIPEEKLEETKKESTLSEEESDSDESSDSGVLCIIPARKSTEKASELSKESDSTIKEDKKILKSEADKLEEKMISDFPSTDEIPKEQILITQREKIQKNLLNAFKFHPTPTEQVNKLIMGSSNLNRYLNEKIKINNWTADKIDKREIVDLCDTTFTLLQIYTVYNDQDHKNTVKKVISKVKDKMDDLGFEQNPDQFYWTDFAIKFVILLLTYEFVVNYETGNFFYRDLINMLIPTVNPEEWREMDYKRIIYFLGPKLVINYFYQTNLYTYDDFDKILRILKRNFEEIERLNLKSQIYYYDFYYKIYKSFDLE